MGFNGGLVRAGGMIGLDDLKGLFQPKWLCDSILCEQGDGLGYIIRA